MKKENTISGTNQDGVSEREREREIRNVTNSKDDEGCPRVSGEARKSNVGEGEGEQRIILGNLWNEE